MPRGGDRGGRKPRLPKHEKREPMHKIRIKKWMMEWMTERFGRQRGRIIEDLLLKEYGEEMAKYNKQINATKTAP